MKIRQADISDAKLITKIQSDGWIKTYAHLLPTSFLQERQFSQERVLRWEKRLQDFHHLVLVAEKDNGEIVGFVWGGRGRDDNIPLQKELYALYVYDTEQGKGYGSALLKSFAYEINESFYLFALKGNDKAKRFYLSKGGILKPEFCKQQEEKGNVLEEECFFFEKI